MKAHNNKKTIYQRTLQAAKDSYLAQGLMKTKGIWNFLKTIKGRSNISIPIIIIESTKNITSNTNIANIINSFFYTKVKNIINKFTTVDYDPLIFVRFLIPKPKA